MGSIRVWKMRRQIGDEEMSELDLVLLAQRKERELDLIEDTKAWIPVSLEKSRFLRSSVPDRILQPRPVLTLTQEVKCRCTLHGFKDPDVLDLVRDRKTESPSLPMNDF